MQPETVVLKAPAKINLFLHITGVLENGYHELDTLFLALNDPADSLTFTPGLSGAGCTVACDIPGLTQEDNLAFKAYQAFAEATGFAPDLSIAIDKRIPAGAGLGGGSTNAASVLRYLNERAGDASLGLDELVRLAAGLGADVPFFLMDTPARATGIGEQLVPTALDLSGWTLLLACPDVHVNTAWAYGAWDEQMEPNRSALTSARTHNTRATPQALPTLHNDFECVVFQAFPAIRMVKERMLAGGAAGAAMSGSGASVFALFKAENEAKRTAHELTATGVKTYLRLY